MDNGNFDGHLSVAFIGLGKMGAPQARQTYPRRLLTADQRAECKKNCPPGIRTNTCNRCSRALDEMLRRAISVGRRERLAGLDMIAATRTVSNLLLHFCLIDRPSLNTSVRCGHWSILIREPVKPDSDAGLERTLSTRSAHSEPIKLGRLYTLPFLPNIIVPMCLENPGRFINTYYDGVNWDSADTCKMNRTFLMACMCRIRGPTAET